MIRVLIIVVALLAGLIFAPELSANKGYILISFDSYTTYETTIINAGFIAILFYFLLLITEWVLRKLLSMSSITRGWFGQRKTRKAQKNMQLGMIALLEGNTKQAQKLLSKSAEQSEVPALTYIAAARASHENGEFNKRDDYLELAKEQAGCKLAVGLVWAELQLDAKQYENGLATLNELNQHFPKNKKVCQYYITVYSELNEWSKLITLIHSQRKLIALNDHDFDALEFHAHQQLFQQLASKDGQLLIDYWHKSAPRWMRKELSYQKAVISALIDNKCGKLAQEFLLDKLQRQFSLPLLPYLQKIELIDYYPIINFLEKQLKKSDHADYVHQALAYLKLKENHQEAAIKHLMESVKSLPNASDYKILASLLEQQGRMEEANLYYRQGLDFAAI
ncbi:heme biosynthesis protein HemY [Psychromonas sp. RZ22]|uniref:heme biosynthesis HemY N-terminal domain-containing protein n=1 Tax=Psychromonas algarum TaxID=2555643 RepID=UPI0010687810|nr:heme biosynthesis HemY N-terminal domain-containing protein [Psychromonas sp. RZ22]TEW53998.1 heme biosynthesis protein HemY [Psychromonas sp. RZ22]